MAKEVTLILADDTYAAAAAWAGGADQVSAYLQRLVETMLANLGQEEQPGRRVRAPGLSTLAPEVDADDTFQLLAEDQRWGGSGG
jgi:hypothetical protein